MQNQKPSTQSISKLFQLLCYMADSRGSVRVQQIAADIKMSQSTVLRYLKSLVQEGYVFQDPVSERYCLTWRICGISEKIQSHLSIRILSGNIASELSAKLGLGIAIVIEYQGECIYLDCIYEPTMGTGQILQRIGKRTPMNSTSSGKILLSGLSEAQLDQIIAQRGLPALTPRTIVTKEDLMKELELTKKRGYAIDDEECEDGLRCIAVPIFDYRDQIAAAICCFGSTAKVYDPYIQGGILPHLREAANEISFRMGSNISL